MNKHYLRELVTNIISATDKGIEINYQLAKNMGYTMDTMHLIDRIFKHNQQNTKTTQFLKTLISKIHGSSLAIYHIPTLQLIYCFDNDNGVFYVHEENLMSALSSLEIPKHWQIT